MTATPFEAASGAAWTTYAEELSWVEAHLGSRLTKIPVGTSVEGREVYALRVGAAAAHRPPLLVVMSAHGNEPAPREAGFAWARDLAGSTDPTIAAFLDATPVYVVPCTNPDGRVADTRENANAIDINRDFIQLTQPEPRAVASLIRRLRPLAILDGHEIPPTATGMDVQSVTTSGGSFTGRDTALAALSADISTAVRNGLTGAGIGNGPYPDSTPTLNTLGTAAALAGSPVLLVEANNNGSATTGTPWQRFGWLTTSLNLWLNYLVANYETALQTIITARADIAKRARTDKTWVTTPAGATVTATGYRLTTAQYGDARHAIDAWGFAYSSDATGVNVWLAQQCAGHAVLMFDPDVTERILSATRLTTTPPRRRMGLL